MTEKTARKFTDNPLVAVILRFQDGSAIRQVFKPPVVQSRAMAAFGWLVAELGEVLNIEIEPEVKHDKR